MRWIFLALFLAAPCLPAERQLTHSPRNHALDNNDNFSPDDRYLCFDTRGSGEAIGRVDTRTGDERILLTAQTTVMAASYHPRREEIVFIHGPSGAPYAKSNRRGAIVDSAGALRFLDYRDAVSPVTPPGAHRGGTHRHEFTPDGTRLGFTYDDHLLPAYGRTVAMLVPRADAPGGLGYWFALLVSVVPVADAKPGDLVLATGDSWVGERGLMRAFVGRVKEADGSFRNSLFVVDIPANVDVKTASAGDTTHFPTPPKGVRVRRLTTTEVTGIARGSRDGKWIAYTATAPDGTKQIFVIGSDGRHLRQVTHAPGGVLGGARWHPSGHYLAVPARDGILVAGLTDGTQRVLASPTGTALVWSNDGKSLAFNRKVGDHLQIFLAAF